MMKKFTALLLSISLMVCFSAVPANAATNSGTSGNVQVTYSITSSYCIVFPDIACTDSENTFTITADYVHISSGKTLYVEVDPVQTLTDGAFYLTNMAGSNSEKLECKIYVSNINGQSTPAPYYISETNIALATFKPEQTAANTFGKLTFTPVLTPDTPVGYYSGYLFYKIKIV